MVTVEIDEWWTIRPKTSRPQDNSPLAQDNPPPNKDNLPSVKTTRPQ